MSVPPSLREEDYEVIEAAVMETARGRWFLAEYARRNRATDTMAVLQAVGRLENALSEKLEPALPSPEIGMHVLDISATIEKLQAELAPLKLENSSASEIMQQIRAAAEEVQETSWALREIGTRPEFCDNLDRNAVNISHACSSRELAEQGFTKVLDAVNFVGERIVKLGESLAPLGPQRADPALLANSAIAGKIPEPHLVQSNEVFIDEVLIMGPASYKTVVSVTQAGPEDDFAALEEMVFAPSSSPVTQMQQTLEEEWSVPIGYDDEEAMHEEHVEQASSSSNVYSLDLSGLSFEENLALFS